MRDLATFLFARPSLHEGAARILDFGNTLSEYTRSPSGDYADIVALRADWEVIGRDFQQALGTGSQRGTSAEEEAFEQIEQG